MAFGKTCFAVRFLLREATFEYFELLVSKEPHLSQYGKHSITSIIYLIPFKFHMPRRNRFIMSFCAWSNLVGRYDNVADTYRPPRRHHTTGNGQSPASIGITYSSSSPQHSGLSTIYRVSGKVLVIGLDIALMVARGVYKIGAGELKT